MTKKADAEASIRTELTTLTDTLCLDVMPVLGNVSVWAEVNTVTEVLAAIRSNLYVLPVGLRDELAAILTKEV